MSIRNPDLGIRTVGERRYVLHDTANHIWTACHQYRLPDHALVCQPEYTECQPATDHRFLDITLHIAPQEWFSRQELEIEDLPEALVGPYLIAFHPSRLIRGSDQRLHPHQLHADGLRGFQRKEALLSHTATDKGIVHTAILLILMRDRHVLHIKRPIPVQLRLEAFILYLEDNDHHHDHADRQGRAQNGNHAEERAFFQHL